MLWKGQRESDNVEDQRSFGGKSLGIGGLVLGAVVVYLMGGDPVAYLAQNAGQVQTQTARPAADEENKKSFVSVVLADTEDVWVSLFRHESKSYRKPKLVLFRGVVNSACGAAEMAMGPFYCLSDQKVYLDLSFLDELSQRLGAPGEFAGAYVIAHEVGHHVQNLLGISMASGRSNRASVQIELQADCFAGVWAKQARDTMHVIEASDIPQALGAAAAVGDDRLQRMQRGTVVPDSFTHGSSAQRVAAFKRGFAGGQIASCMAERF